MEATIPARHAVRAAALRGGRISDKLARASLAAEKLADNPVDYEDRSLDFHPMDRPVLRLNSRKAGDEDRFVRLGRAARL